MATNLNLENHNTLIWYSEAYM